MQVSIKKHAQWHCVEWKIRSGPEWGLTLIYSSILVRLTSQKQLWLSSPHCFNVIDIWVQRGLKRWISVHRTYAHLELCSLLQALLRHLRQEWVVLSPNSTSTVLLLGDHTNIEGVDSNSIVDSNSYEYLLFRPQFLFLLSFVVRIIHTYIARHFNRYSCNTLLSTGNDNFSTVSFALTEAL